VERHFGIIAASAGCGHRSPWVQIAGLVLAQPPHPGVYVKEEGANPPEASRRGAWRLAGAGLALLLEKIGRSLGRQCAGAWPAICRRCGIEANIFTPNDVPFANYVEPRWTAQKLFSDVLISDCGRIVAGAQGEGGWFDISTSERTFAHRRKETMAPELVAPLGWEYPPAVFSSDRWRCRPDPAIEKAFV